MKKITKVEPEVKKRPARKPKITEASLHQAIVELDRAKVEAARAAEVVKDRQAEVLRMFEAVQKDSATVTMDGEAITRITATVVRGTSHRLDSDKLRKALGAAMWNKVTSKVLDKNKLDAFIKAGEIPTVVVAKATDISHNAPYIKITKK